MFLFMLLWFVGAIAVVALIVTMDANKQKKALVLGFVLGLAFFSYRLGRYDGEGSYFHDLRQEMNPFLDELGRGLDGKRKEALKDFMLRADDIKLEPSDYLKDLKGASKLLKPEPNQSLQPTAPSGRG